MKRLYIILTFLLLVLCIESQNDSSSSRCYLLQAQIIELRERISRLLRTNDDVTDLENQLDELLDYNSIFCRNIRNPIVVVNAGIVGINCNNKEECEMQIDGNLRRILHKDTVIIINSAGVVGVS